MIPEDSKPGRSGPWFAWLQGQLCANTVPSKVYQEGQNGVVEGAARMGPCSLLWEHPPAWPCEVVRRGWGQRGSRWGVRAVEGPAGLGGGSGTLEVLRNNCLRPSGNGQPSLFSPGVSWGLCATILSSLCPKSVQSEEPQVHSCRPGLVCSWAPETLSLHPL